MMGALVSALPGSPVLQLLIKVTAALACACGLATLLRRRSAAQRHFVWLAALAAILAIAVLTPLAPRIGIPVHRVEAAAPARVTVPAPTASGDHVSRASGLETARVPPGTSPSAGPAAVLLGLWLAGCSLVLLWS